jgi:hypothetical protein
MSGEKRENPETERPKEEAKRPSNFVESVVKRVIHKSVVDLPVCMGGVPINWAMWEKHYKEDMPLIISECKLLAAFVTNLKNGEYIGSFETQLWVHTVILNDILSCSSGYLKRIIGGVMELRKLDDDLRWCQVLDKVLWCLRNRSTPVVGKWLLWGSGNRFGIDDPHLD